MTADPIAVWSSFLASPEAPKTAMSPLELDGYLTGIVVPPPGGADPAERVDGSTVGRQRPDLPGRGAGQHRP